MTYSSLYTIGPVVGFNLLTAACEQGDLELVKQHLEKGTDVNLQDDDGQTPIMIACREGHMDIANILIKSNASVNLSDKAGSTPLTAASKQGNDDIIELLLQNGASIDDIDSEGRTALHHACFGASIECVQTLLKHEASTTIKDKQHETPYDVAKRMGITTLCKILQPPKTVLHRSSSLPISNSQRIQHSNSFSSTIPVSASERKCPYSGSSEIPTSIYLRAKQTNSISSASERKRPYSGSFNNPNFHLPKSETNQQQLFTKKTYLQWLFSNPSSC